MSLLIEDLNTYHIINLQIQTRFKLSYASLGLKTGEHNIESKILHLINIRSPNLCRNFIYQICLKFMMREYCAEIVHGYLVHQCYAAHHGHHRVRGDVRDHDRGLNLPCEYELDQCRCQYHDCDGDDQGHADDHPVRQN